MFCAAASGAVYNVTPSNCKSLLTGLRPGDTLSLAPGAYPLLYVTGSARHANVMDYHHRSDFRSAGKNRRRRLL